MEKFFSPAVNLMNKFKYSQKFAIIGFLFTFAFLIILFIFLSEINKWLEFTKKEEAGIEYVQSLDQLTMLLQEHRGLLNAYLNNGKHFKGLILERESSIYVQIKKVDKIDLKYGEKLGTTKQWNEIKQNTYLLINKSKDLSAKESFDQHTKLIDNILSFISQIGLSSNLILDPAGETYYLIILILNKDPIMIERMGKVRGLSAGVAAKKAITKEEKRIIRSELVLIKKNLKEINQIFNNLKNINPEYETNLGSYIEKNNITINQFIELIEKEILKPEKITATPEYILKEATKALDVSFKALDREILLLNKKLLERDFAYTLEEYLLALFSAFFLLLIAYLFIGLFISTNRSIQKLQENANIVSQGDLSSRVTLDTKDEINNLAQNFNRMTESIEKLFNQELLLRKILVESGKYKKTEEVVDSLLKHLKSLFKASKVILLKYDEKNDLILEKELSDNKKAEKSNAKILFPEIAKIEAFADYAKNILIIKDVNKEIKEENIRSFLLSSNIQSFLLYPKSFLEKEEKNIGTLMLCFDTPTTIDLSSINFFKVLVDLMRVIYLEVLEKTNAELMRNSFISVLTHELKTPLIAVKTTIKFMLDNINDIDQKQIFIFLEEIDNCNKKQLNLVNNLLSMYYYESEKPKLSLERISFAQVVGKSLLSLGSLAKAKNSTVNIQIEDNLPDVIVDKLIIESVLTNIATNSIMHTPDNTKIIIAAKKQDNKVLVSIQDNGLGIPKEKQYKMFQKYSMLDDIKKKIGTGYGLYLSKLIIEAHNEKLWFESEEGEGTTFYFTLPIAMD